MNIPLATRLHVCTYRWKRFSRFSSSTRSPASQSKTERRSHARVAGCCPRTFFSGVSIRPRKPINLGRFSISPLIITSPLTTTYTEPFVPCHHHSSSSAEGAIDDMIRLRRYVCHPFFIVFAR
ncbi:hypothetical protein SCHPADRAFT_374847 [Schizopora paradoxa]|uniref:Uncharacterized protein n=1 Tax=Schizopora paradoxa TaxID=27342 RepID=A0A0H2RML0_9AGAM|nr:hypothetical protein SCHPADRAFT_374847 [Schizopora paradoxa]